MTTNITVKTKFRVNGQDYERVEDMPPDVRRAYERALATTGGERSGLTRPRSSTKIVFNGQEYASPAQMPAAVRQLYDGVMAAVDANRNGIPDALEAGEGTSRQVQWPDAAAAGLTPESSVAMGAIRPESTSWRLLIVGVAIAAALLAGLALGR